MICRNWPQMEDEREFNEQHFEGCRKEREKPPQELPQSLRLRVQAVEHEWTAAL